MPNSKAVLRSYVEDPEAKFLPRHNGTSNRTKEHVQNPEFWVELDELISLLQPIPIQQKISEANNATLDKAYTHWFEILLHLTAQSRQNRFRNEINNFLMEKFAFGSTNKSLRLIALLILPSSCESSQAARPTKTK